MGFFSSTRRPDNVVFYRKRMYGFYERVLVRSWESGYEIRNGVVYSLQTGIRALHKAPWNDVEIVIVSEADFPVEAGSAFFMESYQVQVQGTVYGRVTDANLLLQTVHNPSDTEIRNLITTACRNALLSILSTFNTFLQVEQTGGNLHFDVQNQVAYLSGRGLTITDMRITHIDLPEEIRRAIHATTASEHTARQIRNIEDEIGQISQQYGYGYFDRNQMRGGEGTTRPLGIADVLSILMLGQFIGGRPLQIPVVLSQPRIISQEGSEGRPPRLSDQERRDNGPRIVRE